MCGKSFMAGLGIGMAAGAVLEAVMMPKKKGKCASGKMMHSIGDIVDSIAGMMH